MLEQREDGGAMDGDADGDRDRALAVENSAAEGDGDRGSRYGLVRCASQSSLDESSQRPACAGAGAGGVGCGGGVGAEHAAALLGALARLRGAGALCDVRLAAGAGGAGLAAHRAVLAAASPYFLAMFTQFEERDRATVTIHNVEPAALEAILEYVYAPDSLRVTEHNVQALLAAASLLAVAGVRDACCAFLAAALAPDNALGIRAFADLHACADLTRRAADYVDAHFPEVVQAEEFLALSADTLAGLLDSDRLTVPSEEMVLDAVVSWMQHDPEAREAQLGALLEHVRLPLLAREALVCVCVCAQAREAQLGALLEHVRLPLLAREALVCVCVCAQAREAQLGALLEHVRLPLLAREALVCVCVCAQAREAQLGALLEHVRLPLLAREALVARARAAPLAGAGLRVKDLLIEALSYHLAPAGERAAAAAASARARPRRAAAARAALLVAGGQAPKAIRDVELLRLDAARWRRAQPLPSRRCRAGLAVLEGRAYAVGGFNGTLRVRSVDVYDIAADAWAGGPPLGARRSTLGVAVLGTTIYAVGGFDGAAGLASAEALDAGADAWRPIAAMGTRRSSVGVAVLEGRLYAVGGYDGAARQCLHTVERYDPALDAWEGVAEMAARRSGCGVGVAEGALYAVGGHDGPAVRRSVERFRAGAGGGGGAWAAAPAMHSARRNAAVAAHRGRLYVVGGDDGAANLSTVEVFDPGADAWTLLAATMSVGRSYAAVAVLDHADRADS